MTSSGPAAGSGAPQAMRAVSPRQARGRAAAVFMGPPWWFLRGRTCTGGRVKAEGERILGASRQAPGADRTDGPSGPVEAGPEGRPVFVRMGSSHSDDAERLLVLQLEEGLVVEALLRQAQLPEEPRFPGGAALAEAPAADELGARGGQEVRLLGVLEGLRGQHHPPPQELRDEVQDQT